MKDNLSEYKTLVFDCDGVILNSNQIKTKAFYQAGLAYGEAAAQALVEYHVVNGGVSRYKKFAHFLDKITPILAPKISGPGREELLKHYAELVLHGLLTCEVAEGLDKLRNRAENVNWLIVSGGDQAELRHVFNERDLSKYFDGGIFGSPDTKDQILEREIKNGNIQQPAIFLGDSKYDYIASNKAGLDFIFLSDWTEVENYEEWCSNESLEKFNNINDIM